MWKITAHSTTVGLILLDLSQLYPPQAKTVSLFLQNARFVLDILSPCCLDGFWNVISNELNPNNYLAYVLLLILIVLIVTLVVAVLELVLLVVIVVVSIVVVLVIMVVAMVAIIIVLVVPVLVAVLVAACSGSSVSNT